MNCSNFARGNYQKYSSSEFQFFDVKMMHPTVKLWVISVMLCFMCITDVVWILVGLVMSSVDLATDDCVCL